MLTFAKISRDCQTTKKVKICSKKLKIITKVPFSFKNIYNKEKCKVIFFMIGKYN